MKINERQLRQIIRTVIKENIVENGNHLFSFDDGSYKVERGNNGIEEYDSSPLDYGELARLNYAKSLIPRTQDDDRPYVQDKNYAQLQRMINNGEISLKQYRELLNQQRINDIEAEYQREEEKRKEEERKRQEKEEAYAKSIEYKEQLAEKKEEIIDTLKRYKYFIAEDIYRTIFNETQKPNVSLDSCVKILQYLYDVKNYINEITNFCETLNIGRNNTYTLIKNRVDFAGIYDICLKKYGKNKVTKLMRKRPKPGYPVYPTFNNDI